VNVFTKLSYFSYAGSISGGFLGAYIASFHTSFIWILATVLAFIAVIIFLYCANFSFKIRWQKLKFKNINFNYDQFFSTYKTGIIDSLHIVKSNHYLRNIILYDAFSQFGMTATVRIWQPYFKQLFHFNSIMYLGLIYTLFSFLGILSSMSGNILSSIRREDKIFYAGLFAGLILLLLLWAKAPIIILSFFFIHVFFQMIKIPLVKSTIHEETPVQHRSTMSSFSSCFGTIIESIGFLFFGILLDESGIRVSLFVASLFFIGSAIFYYYKLKKLEVPYGQQIKSVL
jgi:predicted MFS family arabinose efflux permease